MGGDDRFERGMMAGVGLNKPIRGMMWQLTGRWCIGWQQHKEHEEREEKMRSKRKYQWKIRDNILDCNMAFFSAATKLV
jgi:hypothetical protein